MASKRQFKDKSLPVAKCSRCGWPCVIKAHAHVTLPARCGACEAGLQALMHAVGKTGARKDAGSGRGVGHPDAC